MNPGGGSCGEPRWRHCTPAWITRAKLRLKKKRERERERERERIEHHDLVRKKKAYYPQISNLTSIITDLRKIILSVIPNPHKSLVAIK